MEHIFGRFSPYDPRPAPERMRRAFGEAVERYYEYADEMIGRLLKYADSRTLIMIVSDHGSEPDLETPERSDLYSAALEGQQFWDHYSGSEGILIACGPGIRRGAVPENASILDIAPTLLYFQNLEVAQDMDGRVLKEILEPEWLKRLPERKTASYPFKPAKKAAAVPLTPILL
jgi:predicted AlkP superfamily phosphohydrolase/phosphomutase